MKKRLKKLKIKSINKFKHFLNIAIRILTVMVQTGLICFGMGIALIIINSILGVNIGLSYYMKLAFVATLVISFILVLINWKSIIAKHFKVPSKTVPTAQKVRTQRRIQRNRRNIS